MTARPEPRIAAVTPLAETVPSAAAQDGHIKVEIMYDELEGRDRVHIEVETETPERPYLPTILREMALLNIYPRDEKQRDRVQRRKAKKNLVLALSTTVMVTAVITAMVVVVLFAAFMGRI